MSKVQVEQMSNAVEANKTTDSPKKVVVPPMWFNLLPISNHHMLSHISFHTNHFHDLPRDLAEWIVNDASTRPFSYYGTIPAPPSVEIVKKIIGLDGHYLKLTTTNCGVNFIWHDRSRNEFQFWGDYHRCVRAMKEIRYRICKYVEANKHLLAEKPASASPVKQYVFQNDINPHPAVCLEAIVELDENNQYKRTLASKRYKDL